MGETNVVKFNLNHHLDDSFQILYQDKDTNTVTNI